MRSLLLVIVAHVLTGCLHMASLPTDPAAWCARKDLVYTGMDLHTKGKNNVSLNCAVPETADQKCRLAAQKKRLDLVFAFNQRWYERSDEVNTGYFLFVFPGVEAYQKYRGENRADYLAYQEQDKALASTMTCATDDDDEESSAH